MRDEPSWQKLTNTLTTWRLATSALSNFNDPFEGSPVLVGDSGAEVEINFKSANSIWSPLVAPILKDLDGTKLKAATVIDHFARSLFVVSLSRRINSGLLWSHYANGYRGIALHFTPTNDIESPFKDGAFHWVAYEKQRPFISFESMQYYLNENLHHPAGAFAMSARGATELQLLAAMLTWKSEDWSYEQEARLITSSATLEVGFPKSELASIILGPLCSEADAVRVRGIAARATHPIAIAQARLSRTDYSIEIEW